jgi:hypothetical protein
VAPCRAVLGQNSRRTVNQVWQETVEFPRRAREGRLSEASVSGNRWTNSRGVARTEQSGDPSAMDLNRSKAESTSIARTSVIVTGRS